MGQDTTSNVWLPDVHNELSSEQYLTFCEQYEIYHEQNVTLDSRKDVQKIFITFESRLPGTGHKCPWYSICSGNINCYVPFTYMIDNKPYGVYLL